MQHLCLMNRTHDMYVLKIANLKVAHEGILEIERNSREQSESDVWYAEMSKRVTASSLGSIMERRKKIYPTSILKNVLQKVSLQKLPSAI